MKKILLVCCLSVIVCLGAAPMSSATSTSKFQLQILSLGCSLDITATGQVTYRQITPDACLPFSNEIHTTALPVATPSPTETGVAPTSVSPITIAPAPSLTLPAVYYNAPLRIISNSQNTPSPSVNNQDAFSLPVIGESNGPSPQVKEAPIEPPASVLHPVVAAILVTTVAVLPTGALTPLISQLGALRIRFSRFK